MTAFPFRQGTTNTWGAGLTQRGGGPVGLSRVDTRRSGGAATKRPSRTHVAANAAAQQTRFDHFRQDFNHERPHEALGRAPDCRATSSMQR